MTDDLHGAIVGGTAGVSTAIGGLIGYLLYGDLLSVAAVAVGTGALTTGVVLVLLSRYE